MREHAFYRTLSRLLLLLTGYCVFLQSCRNADDMTIRTKEYFAKEQIKFNENLWNNRRISVN